ncbi:MAG: hypothetical protein P1V51_13365 [Deltaproteobacteria bacterium]|nr:hypothetical protein [Deltaproteobacteria bacterium]
MFDRWLLLSTAGLLLFTGCPTDDDPGDPDGGGASTTPCAELAEAGCRERADCAVDTCFVCSCAPTFHACREASAAPAECPDYDCPQPECCGATADCSNAGAPCSPPGSVPSCGICDDAPGDCTSDAECGYFEICEPVRCSCSGARACVPGCRDPGDGCSPTDPCSGLVLCPTGWSCDAREHPHCVATSCAAAPDCPPDFDCSAGACERRHCQLDLDCEGVCVEGRCYASYGRCELPVP